MAYLSTAGLLLLMAAAAQSPPSQQPVSLQARGIAEPAIPPPVPISHLEELLVSPDVLIRLDRYRVSDVLPATLGLVIDAVVVTGITEPRRTQRGARIELRDPAKAGDRSRVSYLDLEELASLSSSLAEMSTLAAQWSSREETRSTDVSFTSVDGFSVGFHEDFHEQRGFLSAGFVEPLERPLVLTDLPTLRKLIDQAIDLLRSR